MTFNPSKNLSDQIADHLIDQVISLAILPGERILEQKIAKELGVSRSPVREAFRVLEQTGLVELVPRCGARVTAITEERIEAYCDVFILVLGHVVRRCIENHTPRQFDAMTALYDEMLRHAANNDNRNFYHALLKCVNIGIDAAANPALTQLVRSIMPFLKRLQYIAIALKAGELQKNFSYFRRILDAIEHKDVDQGVQAIEAYIIHEKTITLNAVRQSRLASFLESEKKTAP
ncbi:GntR family transcriptional regulator [Desulfatiferula olefinivorans]